MQILIIDNEDSFTFNLFHQISLIDGFTPEIIPYLNLDESLYDKYDCCVISPGPGSPAEYSMYDGLLRSGKPVLGVCLGMQIINTFFGGEVKPLDNARHGVCVGIEIGGISSIAAVYNSLYCSSVPECLEITSAYNGIPMALKHKDNPIAGVQFHPESFMTTEGDKILRYVFDSIGIC